MSATIQYSSRGVAIAPFNLVHTPLTFCDSFSLFLLAISFHFHFYSNSDFRDLLVPVPLRSRWRLINEPCGKATERAVPMSVAKMVQAEMGGAPDFKDSAIKP